MTSIETPTPTTDSPGPSPVIVSSSGACPALFGAAFEADPGPAYAGLRAVGPVAWAELSPGVHGLVVTSHAAATELLSDGTGVWSRDTRTWGLLASGRVPPDSPLVGILGWQPSAFYADGLVHARLSTVIRDCAHRMPHHRLEAVTETVADSVIDTIGPRGGADVVTEYAMRIPMLVFAQLLGCDDDLTRRMVEACAVIIDAGPDAAQAAGEFTACLTELVTGKTRQPGEDIPTWMLQHPNRLTVEEIVGNLFVFTGAGNVPTASWIVQALRLLLTNSDLSADVTAGTIGVRRAMQQTMWDACPVGTFSFHIPQRDTVLAGTPIPAHTLVMVAHHAANTDPRLPAGIDYASRAHLGFGGGPHACPVPVHAAIITHTAITTLLDRLWDIRLTDTTPAPNRPGLFHQCPTHLPTTYTPTTGSTTPARRPAPHPRE